MGKLVGIYLRISDDREGRELGVERQEEDCRKLAAREGDTVVDVYKDNDISASTRSKKARPDYKRLLADARGRYVQKIIAYTSGRLTRRPRELEGQIDLAEQVGTQFHYVASPSFDLNTAAGRRIARILAANDAGESEDISERVTRAKEQARVKGLYLGGGRYFGYEGGKYNADGVLLNKTRVGVVLVPHEAAMIKDAVTRVIAGETLYSICAEWTRKGYPTPGGRAVWHAGNLRHILLRARNAGLVEYDGVVMDGVIGQWETIISVEEWQAVHAILTDPKRASYEGARSLKWIGTNLYRCGKCPSMMRSALCTVKRPGGTRDKLPTYRCKDGWHLTIRAAYVDDAVTETAHMLLTTYGGDLVRSPVEDRTGELHAEANALRVRLAELEDLFGDGLMSKAGYVRQQQHVTERLTSVESSLSTTVEDAVLYGVATAKDPVVAFDNQPVARRRAIVDTLMTVTVLPGRRGRKATGSAFDGSRLVIAPRHDRAA